MCVCQPGGAYVEILHMNAPAGDLIAVAKYLQTRKEINKNELGLMIIVRVAGWPP